VSTIGSEKTVFAATEAPGVIVTETV